MKYVIGIILILLFLLPLLKIKVQIMYDHNGKDDNLSILIKTLGFIRYKVKFPQLAIDDESASLVYKEERESALGEKEIKNKYTIQRLLKDLQNVEKLLKHVVGFHSIVRNFLKKVSVKEFKWITLMGTGDAAVTGSASGALWAIKGNILGVITNYLVFKTEPKISIEPQFQQMVLKTSFKCMVSFRIGHAILAGLKVLRHWKKGRTLFKNSTEQTVGRDMNV